MQASSLFDSKKAPNITLRVSENLPSIVDDHLNHFSSSLNKAIDVTVITSTYNQTTDFFHQNPDYDIAILSKEELAKIIPSFQIVNTPLFFPSLDFMNLSLNSKSVLSYLNETIEPIYHAKIFGFFYGGNDIFATILPPSFFNSLNNSAKPQPNTFKDTIKLITTSPALASTLQKIAIPTVFSQNASDTYLAFNSNPSENNIIHLPITQLEQLEKQPNLSLLEGFVTPNYYCVLVSNSFYNSLNATQRATLNQELATLYAGITNEMVISEDLLLTQASATLNASILSLNQNPALVDTFYNAIFTNQIISQEIFTSLYLIFSSMR